MNTKNVLLLAGVAGLAYFLYTKASQLASTAVNAAGTAGANLWLSLFPMPATMGLVGNIILPDGTALPLSNSTIRQDSAGNVFTTFGGHIYQLGQSDINGDFEASFVS